jgi:hypothetical protein
VNGFVEIYADGWKRYRWQFTLEDYKSFPYEQQVDLRKADLDTIIAHLKEHVVPNFDPSRIEIFIAYESKMNYEQIDNNDSEPGTGSMAPEQLQDVQQGSPGATPEYF